MIPLVLKATVLLLLGALVARLLHRRSAALRHLVWGSGPVVRVGDRAGEKGDLAGVTVDDPAGPVATAPPATRP